MLLLVLLPIFMQAAEAPRVEAPSLAAPASGPAAAGSAPAGARVVRLTDAVAAALEHQPALHQARAQRHAAEGRLTQARSGFYPQLTAVASYQRVRSAARGLTTTATAGGAASAIPAPDPAGVDIYTVGGTLTQLVWDWGATYNRSRSASRFVESFVANEQTSSQSVVADVRRSFFTARAQKALAGVAKESLGNLQRHLTQIEGFVAVGTRPEIDLAQARTDIANGRLTLINAENAYAVARAQLGRAMGLAEGGGEFDVADDELGPVDGEELASDRLVERAIAARPELRVFDKQREANEFTASAFRGNYGPTLSASASASETGTDLAALGPAWSLGVNLNWPLFQGGLTHGQVREAEANADLSRAQGDAIKVQIRVDVEQAQLGVRAAKASQLAASEVIANARERLRLAEGRYASGVGSVIELGDSQLALTTAAAQVVQANYQLSSARADLLAALGTR